MLSIIQVVEATIAARDPYTTAHQRRVAEVAWNIALEMGLSQDRLQSLLMASIIHDLGKIAIPAEILGKPAKLTNIEYSLIKKHPEVAYSILKPIKFPNQMSNVILQHHERINGSGYPLGLKGKEILLEAKILAVADVFEAMTSHRPYRPALGIEKANEELRQNRGIFYDGEVVEACLQIYENGLEENSVIPGSGICPLPPVDKNAYSRTVNSPNREFGLQLLI
jgi:HD-GYP domain-containing protein (c-di-GMP phosphodiesterase class II)